MPNSGDIAPEWDELALEVGKFMRYWGFKVIHGRIWTHIFLSKKPLDAGTLMERFGLSKALMSLSLKDLLTYKVILEGPKSDKGTQTYVANPNILEVILNVLRRREKRMLAELKTSQELLLSVARKNEEPLALNLENLEAMGEMITQAQCTLEAMLELSNIDFKSFEFLNQISSTPLESDS
ncbi:MAG TPA: hypothetical protein DCL41_08090 [Bdellovibrionales bacterium]|nr:hypothetical protein [Bdellovibrionales bacterium]|tara:strand:+ start:42399 stop:42941 length:543 start_codon:yes stop_codon:yes gene_type:complete